MAAETTQTTGTRDVPIPELLEMVVDRGASDLHLTTGTPPVVRLNGVLHRLENYEPLEPDQLQRMIYSILTQRQRERLEQDLELDVSYALPGKGRFRVNVYFQRDALGAAFRM
ncbi:MAG: type IV pili twitching motility protein PilT, partial [Actinomycetota bacterium]